MNIFYQKILWYIFGIIITRSFAQKNKDSINSLIPNWPNLILNENETLSENVTMHIANIKQHFQIMLTALDKIENILNSLEKNETYVYRRRRFTSKFKPRGECKISKQELFEMTNEIENILEMQGSIFLENNCNININTENCSELINVIKCGIHHLKNYFTEITNVNDISKPRFNIWKVKYEKLHNAYLRVVDDLNKFDTQSSKLKIDDMNKEFIKLKKIINNLEKELNVANKNLIQTTIEFCSSEIHSRKVKRCMDKLKQLKNINYTEIINKIIERSFIYIINDNEMIIIEFIIDFINEQNFTLKHNGYEYLYNLLNIRDYLSTPYVLTFASKVQNYQNEELKTYVKNKIDEWSNEIISGNCWQINTYAEKQDYSFCYYLKEMITNAYAYNNNNAKNIIYFLDNLSTTKQKTLGYYYLYNEIKLKHEFNGDDIIMLVYRIKETLDDNPELVEVINIQQIKSEIPAWLHALLWDNYVSIKSEFNNYKLISLHKYFINLFYTDTILAICPSYTDGADKWKLTAEDKGSYFKVRNVANGHNKEYFWKIISHNNGLNSYIMNKNTGNKLHTINTIGGWDEFWFALPKDCYRVYEYGGELQQWIIY